MQIGPVDNKLSLIWLATCLSGTEPLSASIMTMCWDAYKCRNFHWRWFTRVKPMKISWLGDGHILVQRHGDQLVLFPICHMPVYMYCAPLGKSSNSTLSRHHVCYLWQNSHPLYEKLLYFNRGSFYHGYGKKAPTLLSIMKLGNKHDILEVLRLSCHARGIMTPAFYHTSCSYTVCEFLSWATNQIYWNYGVFLPCQWYNDHRLLLYQLLI